jgi:general secretion pathway protein I
VGDADFSCEELGVVYSGTIVVRPTPNPSFRRVDAQVFDGRWAVLRLSTVVGRY